MNKVSRIKKWHRDVAEYGQPNGWNELQLGVYQAIGLHIDEFEAAMDERKLAITLDQSTAAVRHAVEKINQKTVLIRVLDCSQDRSSEGHSYGLTLAANVKGLTPTKPRKVH